MYLPAWRNVAAHLLTDPAFLSLAKSVTAKYNKALFFTMISQRTSLSIVARLSALAQKVILCSDGSLRLNLLK